MKTAEKNYCSSKLSEDVRKIENRRGLMFVIIASFCAMICVACFVFFTEKKREKAAELIVSEHYSLICDGIEKELSLPEQIQVTAERFADYEVFRFDDEAKTVRCTNFVFDTDLAVILLVTSFVVLLLGGGVLMLNEMYYPTAKKEEIINEKR